MNKTYPNSRRYVRVSCNAAAVVTCGEETLAGVCNSLSVGGAFVQGSRVPATPEIKLVLSLPSLGTIEVLGEVRYSREDGFGICFTHLPPAALRAICNYVRDTLN